MAGPSVNFMQTTNAAGSFNYESTGYIQGMTMDSPAIRNSLCGGVVAAPSALPGFPAGSPQAVLGGFAISEFIPTGYTIGSSAGPKALGPQILPATGIGGALPVTGFSVYDQAHHGIATPQSPVPQYLPGMSVHFYRLGSGARIALAVDPTLISLQGALTTSQVSFDYVGQRVVAFAAAYAANAITAATYNNATGLATYTTTTAHGLAPGAGVSFTGITPAGYNGSFTAATGTAGSTINVQMAAGLNAAGAMPAATAFGTLAAGGGALPGKILEIAPTNCMVAALDSVSGNATWNRNGACALVLI